MPHALLLSPDDQAVSAITGVLEEMSVTCERPLDGVSAAQKLNSQSFDLVLVDCENLPAAKLIFDVCRRGKNGHNPVPIAIVDGRAGLPTAFRLGAELILTKPVSKDQARTTIRTAVSRVRKDIPATEGAPAQLTSPIARNAEPAHELAHAAVASTASLLTSFDDAAPSFSPIIAGTPATTAFAASPALTAKMQSAVDEIVAPLINSKPSHAIATAAQSSSSSALSEVAHSAAFISELASIPDVSANVKPKLPLIPSDDPVLAELERTEKEESEKAEKLAETKLEPTEPAKAAATPAVKSDAPVLTYPQGRQKTRGSLAALFALMLAVSGFYAAWMYQPGFQAIAQPQIDRVLALAGMAKASQNAAPVPVRNVPKPAVQTTPAPTAPGTVTDSNQTQSTTADSIVPSTVGTTGNSIPATSTASKAAATASSATSIPAPVAPTPAMAAAGIKAVAPSATKAGAAKTIDTKAIDTKTNDAKLDGKKPVTAAAFDAPLPGESSAIILSSKGAEKRLAHSVQPKYPAEATGGSQGTVVLKEIVDQTGKVEGVRLVEGDATLAAAAMKAVKQWHYRPYLRDGKALPFQTVVIIDFQKP
jgi:periplasmic protein TonB